jgi:antirestriction protein
MTTDTETPRIYVACLAAYNAGHLHGRWIDAVDEDEIREEVQAMLAESPIPNAEEWAIHDYEGFPHLDESEDFADVAELGAAIQEHGAAYVAYADYVGAKHATVQGFEEAYRGEWDSEKDYAENLFDELYLHEVPDNLKHYVDYEKFARELFIYDCCSVGNPAGGIFVFWRL